MLNLATIIDNIIESKFGGSNKKVIESYWVDNDGKIIKFKTYYK